MHGKDRDWWQDGAGLDAGARLNSTPTFQGYEMTFTGWWCSTAPACSRPAQLPVGAHTVNIHNTPSHPSHCFQVTHQYSTFTGASVNLASVQFSSSKKEM